MTTMREALGAGYGTHARQPDGAAARGGRPGRCRRRLDEPAIHDVYWGSWPTIRIRTRRTKTGARSMIAALQKVSA